MIVGVCLDLYSRHFAELIHEKEFGFIALSMGTVKTSQGEFFIERRSTKNGIYHFNVSSPNFSMNIDYKFDHRCENPDAAIFVVDNNHNDEDDLWRISVKKFKYRVITTQELMEQDFVFMKLGI